MILFHDDLNGHQLVVTWMIHGQLQRDPPLEPQQLPAFSKWQPERIWPRHVLYNSAPIQVRPPGELHEEARLTGCRIQIESPFGKPEPFCWPTFLGGGYRPEPDGSFLVPPAGLQLYTSETGVLEHGLVLAPMAEEVHIPPVPGWSQKLHHFEHEDRLDRCSSIVFLDRRGILAGCELTDRDGRRRWFRFEGHDDWLAECPALGTLSSASPD